MKTLINDLLTYSRVGTRGDPPLELTEFESILSRVLDAMKIPIDEKGVLITHDPLQAIMADAAQIAQLFHNLISNAVKFCNNRRPEIHMGAERIDHEWLFFVRDNGIGIDPQYFERIFIIFQRLHTPEKFTDTGIGLAICKKIVECRGGRIWVESDRGSTFYFTIAARPIQKLLSPFA